MRSSSFFLGLLAAAIVSHAAIHHMIVGTFGDAHLYTLAFDDETLSLELVQTTNTTGGSSWISLSHDKKNLYGTLGSDFASWTVENSTSLTYSNSLPLGGNCTSSRAIFVASDPSPPYSVYGTPFGSPAGCGVVMTVTADGALSSVQQNYTYLSTSGVHGLAFSPSGKYLYSADDSANSIWTHSIDRSTGALTQVSRIAGPSTGSDPRHLATHPNGTYLYVLLEGANALAQYSILNSSAVPVFTNVTYPLISTNASNAAYWSDEVALSVSGSYLWATSRARAVNSTGYISAFSLSSSGKIEKQLFLTPTTSSGGTANSVSPAGFGDRWAALTDSSAGFVEVWRLDENGAMAEAVAHLSVGAGRGCCANAVWYD